MADKSYFVHPTANVDGETAANGFVDPLIGAGTKIWHHAHVSKGARLGAGCNLGQNVYVGGAVVLGRGCKVQNNVNLYDGVELEDFVFCGPSMTFTNLSSPLPRSAIPRHQSYQRTLVRRHASLGAHATIVCGHTLGEACFVAAGAVVTRDVPAYALVAGNPARRLGWVCECGARLAFEGDDAACDATYELEGREVRCGRRYHAVGPDAIAKIHDAHEGG